MGPIKRLRKAGTAVYRIWTKNEVGKKLGLVAGTAGQSSTAGVAALVGGSGAVALLNPEIIDLVPDQYKPYLILGVAATVLLARLRKELVSLVRELRMAWREELADD